MVGLILLLGRDTDIDGHLHADHLVPVPKREFHFSVVLLEVYVEMLFACTPILPYFGPETLDVFITVPDTLWIDNI